MTDFVNRLELNLSANRYIDTHLGKLHTVEEKFLHHST